MKPAKTFGIVAAGCFVAVCAAAIGLVVTLRSCTKEPEEVTVAARAPLNAATGSTFEIVATVTNHSSKPRRLVDIDIADEYLKGVAIESSEPPYQTSAHVPIDDTISHHFGITIPPKASIQIRFKAYAAYAGDYAGNVDFCIDSETSCSSNRVRTIVKP